MSQPDIRQTVLRLLGDVAPEADLGKLAPDQRIRDQLDIDSMDALNFLIAIDAELGIDIPESDYPKLTTLDNIVEYLVGRLGGSS
jgi:acyl carrier protein